MDDRPYEQLRFDPYKDYINPLSGRLEKAVIAPVDAETDSRLKRFAKATKKAIHNFPEERRVDSSSDEIVFRYTDEVAQLAAHYGKEAGLEFEEIPITETVQEGGLPRTPEQKVVGHYQLLVLTGAFASMYPAMDPSGDGLRVMIWARYGPIPLVDHPLIEYFALPSSEEGVDQITQLTLYPPPTIRHTITLAYIENDLTDYILPGRIDLGDLSRNKFIQSYPGFREFLLVKASADSSCELWGDKLYKRDFGTL